MGKKSNSRSRSKTSNRPAKLANRLLPGPDKASNPSQVQVGMWLQGPPTKFTTQASTGLITSYVAPSLSALTNAASFKTVYDEWRLTALKFSLFPLGSNGGVTKFIMDDADNTLPNSTFAFARRGFTYSNNSANHKSTPTIKYRSEDITDLEWYSTASASAYTPMALKIYTDLSNYVSQPSTDLWLVIWEGFFEFRGIGQNA